MTSPLIFLALAIPLLDFLGTLNTLKFHRKTLKQDDWVSYEKNPLARYLMRNMGFTGLLPLFVLNQAVILILTLNFSDLSAYYFFYVGVYVVVLENHLHNALQIRRHHKAADKDVEYVELSQVKELLK